MENKLNYTSEEVAGYMRLYARVINHSKDLFGNRNTGELRSAVSLTQTALSDYETNVPDEIKTLVGDRLLGVTRRCLDERIVELKKSS